MFDCSRCGESCPRDSTHILHQSLPRKVCQTVQFHHDLIGSAKVSESCRTRKHRLLIVFKDLRTHWRLQLLERLRHSHQGRNQHPLFLVQLCLAVFRQDLVKKKQCTSVCTKITPVLLLSETNKRQNWFLNCTPRGKALELFVLLEVCMSPVVPPSCGSQAPLAVWIPGSGNDTFCPGYVSGQACSCAPLSRSKYSAPACLLVDTELIVTPMIHGSTFELHESSPSVLVFVKDTTRLKLLQKADSFPQRPRVCFSLCLSCDSCLSARCCCCW